MTDSAPSTGSIEDISVHRIVLKTDERTHPVDVAPGGEHEGVPTQ